MLVLIVHTDEWYWVGICMHIKFLYPPITVMPHPPKLVVGGDYERGLTSAARPLVVLYPDRIFRAHWKMGLVNCLNSVFIQVCQNVGALIFSNLMLENCIPHC